MMVHWILKLLQSLTSLIMLEIIWNSFALQERGIYFCSVLFHG
jgi:hypothetical protein